MTDRELFEVMAEEAEEYEEGPFRWFAERAFLACLSVLKFI